MSVKKRVKKILLPIVCKTLLAPKSFFSPPSHVRKIECTKQDVTLMTQTSNNVFCVRVGGETLYFRECKVHKKIRKYVQDDIDFYYGQLCPEHIEDKHFVEMCLLDRRNFKRFIHMGITNDTSSGAYQFCMGRGGEHVGLPGATPPQEERLRAFVQFIWGDLFAYTLNSGVKIGQYQIYNAVRSMAWYRLAGLFETSWMIPKTEYALLCIDGQPDMFGTVMEHAPGVCMEKMPVAARKQVCSPALQRELNNLNLLDVICMEKDHRVGNYHVMLDGGRAVSVVAFDNDSPNSFGIGGISFSTYIGCSPWALRGHMNRPYVDRTLAAHVLEMDEKELQKSLSDLLNACQLFALKRRIRALKKILASISEDQCLSEEQWGEATIQEELSGQYGDTYLVKFLQEQKTVVQPWIKSE